MKNYLVFPICILGSFLIFSSCQHENSAAQWDILTELQVDTAPASVTLQVHIPLDKINAELKRMGKQTTTPSLLTAQVELDVLTDYEVKQDLAKDKLDINIRLLMKPGQLQIKSDDQTPANTDMIETGRKLMEKELQRITKEVNSKRYPLTSEEIQMLRSGAAKEVVIEKPIPVQCAFGGPALDVIVKMISSPGKTWIE